MSDDGGTQCECETCVEALLKGKAAKERTPETGHKAACSCRACRVAKRNSYLTDTSPSQEPTS